MTTLRQVMKLVDAYAEERCKGNEYDNRYSETSARHSVLVALKNYTTPPQRQPLTDEQIEDLYFDRFSMGELKAFARAIEAAHGIKGEA